MPVLRRMLRPEWRRVGRHFVLLAALVCTACGLVGWWLGSNAIEQWVMGGFLMSYVVGLPLLLYLKG